MSIGEPVGTVGALWRFPVKSMLGEELDEVDVDEGGIVGDRAFALADVETGKVASAKHPKVWPDLLRCRASYVVCSTVARGRTAAGADRTDRR